MNKLLNTALQGLDTLGFQLDSLGITSKVNRHTLIALAMNEQKRMEGELDSLKARVGSRRFQVEQLVGRAERLARGSADLALHPRRISIDSVRGLLKN